MIFSGGRACVRIALSAIAFSIGAGTIAVADVPRHYLKIDGSPVPDVLDLRGAAVRPESRLRPCSKDDRSKLQPDLDAIENLVTRAGGMRLRKPDFQAGSPITTPDGLIMSLKPTANGSYVVSIDSTRTHEFPAQYFDACLKLVLGNGEKMGRLNLLPPYLNFGTAQFSPAVGFYLYTP